MAAWGQLDQIAGAANHQPDRKYRKKNSHAGLVQQAPCLSNGAILF
jgi:hypothetical protein